MTQERILLGLSDILLAHMNRIAKEEKIPRAVLIRTVLQNFVIGRNRAALRRIERNQFLEALKADRKRERRAQKVIKI